MRWLLHLGPIGLFGLAVIDSSLIPIPIPGSTDLILLLLTSFRSRSASSPIIFAVSAFAGSAIGGYLAWAAGKRGGEAALAKLGKGGFVRRIHGWVRQKGMVSIGLAALVPPPIPLTPLLFAAGALGLSRNRFLIAYCAARAARYGAVAWLGHRYGRAVVVMWQRNLSEWTTPILTAYVALVIAGTGYGIWKYSKDRRRGR
jgi:membrane protein YqaA with SNARE-associated domain